MSVLELMTSMLAFIVLLSAVVLYLWQTPTPQQKPVTLRQPDRVKMRRRRWEM